MLDKPEKITVVTSNTLKQMTVTLDGLDVSILQWSLQVEAKSENCVTLASVIRV